MGTDAYTQEELEAAIRALEYSFGVLYNYARAGDWTLYRLRMRKIDLQYRQLRSQGPDLGTETTRQ